MGIFNTTGSSINENLDINNTSFIESASENPFDGGCVIVAETEANYCNIMKSIAISELCYLEENHTEMVYESSTFSGFIGKMKEFFKNLFEKIKGLFIKFFATLNSFLKTDKEFVSKYRQKIINHASLTDFKFKGFKFTELDKIVNTTYPADACIELSKITSLDNEDSLNKLILSENDYENVLDKYRGTTVNESSIESDEYNKELFKYFRNGEDKSDDVDNINVTDLLSIILQSKDAKQKAEKDLSAFKKTIDDLIKGLEKADKELNKENTTVSSAKIRAINFSIKGHKACLSINTSWNSAKLSAIKDQNRQAKSICVKLLTWKPKNEGFVYTEGGSGFLDDVVIR